MKSLITLLTILTIFLAFSSCVEDPSTMSGFSAVGGKVTEENGTPIEGVTVKIAGEQTTTNSKGYYIFDKVSGGEHTLTAEKYGYISNSKQVNIENGKISNGDISLIEGTIPEGFVYVKGGTFEMGSNDGSSNEQPVHTVTLDDFYISKYEVTQAEYEEVMGTNPSYHSGDDKPVEQVSWYNAVEYCNKLSENEGLTKFYNINGTDVTMNWDANGYRLPTEAEWEFAARGGNQSNGYTYSGSDNIDDVAWYSGNSGSDTHPVGTKDPNELGIYDMSGNVWEWCNDWYDADYYDVSPENNPQGPGSGKYRVLRGGSWDYNAYYCRVALRFRAYLGDSFDSLGFRIVQDPVK